MKKPVLMFDFDGVILDSYSAAFGFNQERCPHFDHESYRDLFRGNINESTRGITHTDACRRVDNYFEAYAPHMEPMVFFEGMEDLVRRLAEKFSLYIISSCSNELIKRSLTKHTVSDYFIEILGNDTNESKVEKINDVLARTMTSPRETLFITDTVGDIREAREAGVASIAVSWGYHSFEWLREANPLHLVHSVAELDSAITDFFKK